MSRERGTRRRRATAGLPSSVSGGTGVSPVFGGRTGETPAPPSRRRGVSLMEVLISVFVLSMGLIGMAALLPLGRFAINETGKADRAGACGRAALREIKVRHMLDPAYPTWPVYDSHGNQILFSSTYFLPWQTYDTSGNQMVFNNSNGDSFIVDPMGMLKRYNNGTGNFVSLAWIGQVFRGAGGAHQQRPARVTYSNMLPTGWAAAANPFAWQDDLTFTNPEDLKLPSTAAPGPSMRPLSTVQGAIAGNYSWFFTVTPSAAEVNLPATDYEPRHYSVSVVVCYGATSRSTAAAQTRRPATRSWPRSSAAPRRAPRSPTFCSKRRREIRP